MDSWQPIMAQSPLAQDWSGYLQQQVPSTGWWKDIPTPFAYSQGYGSLGKSSFDYHPGGRGEMYEPESNLGWSIIRSDIDQWMLSEFPELFDFTAGWQTGGVGGIGTVARDPSFGQFSKTPEVYDEIQAAASKYGVPANFLQAIIASESSGDWAGNNRFWYGRPSMGPLLPYVGVFQSTAQSRGFGDLWARAPGNRAVQIELLAAVLRSQYDQIRKQNPQYGWLNVASYHYSGNPQPGAWRDELPGARPTSAQYTQKVETWWKSLDQKAGNTWSNFTDFGQSTGVGSPQTQAWANTNRYDEFIVQSAAKYGVPANLVKAIIRAESNGSPNAVSPQGATGLMQVMPFHVGGNQSILFDPKTNIDVGTRILMENYRRYGSWEMAAKAYLGLGGADALGTTSSVYWNRVQSYWNELNAGSSGMFGAPGSGSGGQSTPLSGIWGNVPATISQEHGRTSFASSNPNMYAYSHNVLGYLGHPGIDVAFPRGTQLYSPVAGTVITAGGASYDFYGNKSPGVGELRIRLDNGHEVILGHMMRISVQPGTRVTPGMPVGLSGGAGTGDHLHLEYRIPNPNFTGGWEAVDPRKMITGGIIPGGHQTAYTGLGSAARPLTYQNLLLAAAKGETIPQGATYSSGGGSNSWNTMLRSLMAGQVPRFNLPGYTFTPPGGR